MDDARDAEEELDDGVPMAHGPGLDPPGALGEPQEVEVHEEDARCRREEAQELGEEDPAADDGVETHEVEEAAGGGGEEVGLAEQRGDGGHV